MIDYDALARLESSGNPRAYNFSTKATGLYQIRPTCLRDYNNSHAPTINQAMLFREEFNKKVATWYLEERIPELLASKGITDPTLDEVLISYNAGFMCVVYARMRLSLSSDEIPLAAIEFVQNYKDILASKNKT